MKKNKKEFFSFTKDDRNLLFWILGLSVVLVPVLIIFGGLIFFESLRIVFGSILVLFLPGYVISSLFFNSSEIDILEKIALSFGLSIAVVPLVSFYFNFFLGFKINVLNILLIISGIIGVSFLVKLAMRKLNR
ncbi:MAG: DUF1616 domain-containing protein [Nanoarchaeota archaeon]